MMKSRAWCISRIGEQRPTGWWQVRRCQRHPHKRPQHCATHDGKEVVRKCKYYPKSKTNSERPEKKQPHRYTYVQHMWTAHGIFRDNRITEEPGFQNKKTPDPTEIVGSPPSPALRSLWPHCMCCRSLSDVFCLMNVCAVSVHNVFTTTNELKGKATTRICRDCQLQVVTVYAQSSMCM